MDKIVQNQGQQGDVLFNRISPSELPKGERKVLSKDRMTFALGEKTGHHHTMELAGGEFFEIAGKQFCEIPDNGTTVHQEHRGVTMSPGLFQIGIVNQYDPISKLKSRVVD